MGIAGLAQQVAGADGTHDQGGGEVGGQHHVDEAVGEGRVEDHRPPVGDDELADLVDAVAGRRLHPAVDREDPERRHEGAGGDHQRGEEVQPRPDPVEPEQHDAEEAGLEEEGREHLVAHERPEHRADLVGEHAPVGAELVAHDDAGNDAHAEGDGEDLLPVIEQVEEQRAPGPQPQALEHGEVARQPDREGREDDVEADGERELDARQQHRVEQVHEALRRDVG